MEETKRGRVIQSTGRWYEVAYAGNGNGDIIKCRLPGRFRLKDRNVTNPIAVGDYVKFTLNADNTGNIEEIEDRDNYLLRQSTHQKQDKQVLAANIDHAFVVLSIREPKLKQGFLDRFLVTCEAYRIPPGIIINKEDLASEDDRRYLEDLQEIYTAIGYPFLITSIHDESSLEALKEVLAGQTSVFIGPSGVGKTSLINYMDPGIDRAVAEISSYNEKGKHTTTFARLLSLHSGGYLVDTPGIREFGLVDIEPWELSLFFPEMLEPRRNCKFNNCTHSHEPGCGVMEAYEEGKIHPDRYNSYLNILESL